MTVCPRCKGNGSVPYPIDYEQGLFDETNCDLCGGSGEVEMTNEEWIKQCNTEQLAEWITDIVYECRDCDDCMDCRLGWCSKDCVIEWLKQPHTPKE